MQHIHTQHIHTQRIHTHAQECRTIRILFNKNHLPSMNVTILIPKRFFKSTLVSLDISTLLYRQTHTVVLVFHTPITVLPIAMLQASVKVYKQRIHSTAKQQQQQVRLTTIRLRFSFVRQELLNTLQENVDSFSSSR